MSTTIDEHRLATLPPLLAGNHEGGWVRVEFCVMEAVSWVAEDSHTDEPACVCPTLVSAGQIINDQIDDATRQRLIGYIRRLINTARGEEGQQARAMAALAFVDRLPGGPEGWRGAESMRRAIDRHEWQYAANLIARRVMVIARHFGETRLPFALLDAMLAVDAPTPDPAPVASGAALAMAT